MRIEAEEGARGGRAFDGHVQAGRSDVDHAGEQGFTVGCFTYGQRAQRIEALRERRGKTRRHVLHDHDGDSEVAGEKRENILQSFWASGGRSDGDNQRGVRSWFPALRRGWAGRFLEKSFGSKRFARQSGGANLGDEILLDVKDVERGGGQLFGNVIIGAGIQALYAVFDPGALSQDQHGQARFFQAQVAKNGDAVHLRQVQVENHDVIVGLAGGVSRLLAVGKNIHRVMLALKTLANEFGQRFIIFGNKNSHNVNRP